MSHELRSVVETHVVRRPVYEGQWLQHIDDAVGVDGPTSIASASRVNSSITLSILMVRPSVVVSNQKSIAQMTFGRIGDGQARLDPAISTNSTGLLRACACLNPLDQAATAFGDALWVLLRVTLSSVGFLPGTTHVSVVELHGLGHHSPLPDDASIAALADKTR